MQVSFTSVISSLPPNAERRCCAKLQRGDVQCPNKAKFVFDNEFYFCGVHLKPTSESVTRMSSPIMHQTKFGDKPVVVVSSVPSVSVSSVSVPSVSSVVPVVPDLSSDVENKEEIKQLRQQLQELQQLFGQQQEIIKSMFKQIELLTIKVEGEEKKNQEEWDSSKGCMIVRMYDSKDK